MVVNTISIDYGLSSHYKLPLRVDATLKVINAYLNWDWQTIKVHDHVRVTYKA